MKKVAIACDHGGLKLKQFVIDSLKDRFDFNDCGTYSEESCDYPDFAIKAASVVANKQADFGIVICRSGVGVSIAANKVKGIRCALVYNLTIASLCKKHNKANVIAFGADYMSKEEVVKCILAYDNETFEDRHQTRIDKITSYESK